MVKLPSLSHAPPPFLESYLVDILLALGKVDLLAVLMHETGHFLDLDHSENAHNVMAERLPTGTRRFPSAEDVDLAILNGLGDDIDRDRRRR